MSKDNKKTIFYGSIYDDERNRYVKVVEEQFARCSEKFKDMEIVAWGFDVLVKDESKKREIESWVRRCATKYFPTVKNISELK